MPDTTFQYITRPTNNGDAITTQPKYRGSKTTAEVYAEVTARIGASPLTVPLAIQVFHEVVIDWTSCGWKIEPVAGLAGYLIGSGGSNPLGAPEDWNFESMGIDLRGYWGEAGRQRSEAAFSAEKVGEQNRVAPVFTEVYDSGTKTPNHYVAGAPLTINMGNKGFKFDTVAGSQIRFRKGDGTYVTATSYAYIKGRTVVVIVPAGLTGSIELEMTCFIYGMSRTGTYPFPLT